MKFGVIQFPGSCDEVDALKATSRVGEAVLLWHRDHDLQGVDAVIVPGGFSYGDYLRAGALARFSPVMEAVADFAREGGPVLGICNGFQVLCEAGLLPGALLGNEHLRFRCRQVDVMVEVERFAHRGGLVLGICNGFQVLCEAGLLPGALLPNTSLRFTFRQVELDVVNASTRWTAACEPRERLSIPAKHQTGRYWAPDPVLDELEAEGQVVLRYATGNGFNGSGAQ